MNALKEGLEQFIGTEYYHQTVVPNIVTTDGVNHFAEKNDCYWLINEIAWYTMRIPHPFVSINITCDKGLLNMHFEDGNLKPLRKDITIEGADLPDGEIDIWKENDVLLLPSEH